MILYFRCILGGGTAGRRVGGGGPYPQNTAKIQQQNTAQYANYTQSSMFCYFLIIGALCTSICPIMFVCFAYFIHINTYRIFICCTVSYSFYSSIACFLQYWLLELQLHPRYRRFLLSNKFPHPMMPRPASKTN